MLARCLPTLLFLLLALPSPPLQGAPCQQPFSAQAGPQVFNAIPHVDGPCALEFLNVDGAQLSAQWTFAPPSAPPSTLRLNVWPSGCAPDDAQLLPRTTSKGQVLLVQGLEDLRERCPASAQALSLALETLDQPYSEGGSGEEMGDLHDTTVARAATLFALLLAALGMAILASRGGSARSDDGPPRARWIPWLMGLIALAPRLWVQPNLANWYDYVWAPELPSGWTRFGPAGPLLQRALFALLPSTDTTLFAVGILLGALSLVIFARVLQALKLSSTVTVVACLTLALDPVFVRISASSSTHMFTITLSLLALLALLRAEQEKDDLLLAGSLSLLPLVAFIRVDAWLGLVTLPLWLALLPGIRWGTWLRKSAIFGAIWGLVGLAAWALIVRHSNHPPPQWIAVRNVALDLFHQYPAVALEEPGWVSWTSIALALLGWVWLARYRPRAAVLMPLALAAIFIPLGRNLRHDGILGDRYLLFTLPIVGLLAGHSLAWLWPRRGDSTSATQPEEDERRSRLLHLPRQLAPALAPALCVLIALLLLLDNLPAYRFRYAYMDEYDFLKSSTASLPTGCTVAALPVRVQGFQRDLDCCLDPPNSPLILARPKLHWVHLPQTAEALRDWLEAPPECSYLYWGAPCSMEPSRESLIRDSNATLWYQEACAQLKPFLLHPLAQGLAAPHATNPLFGQEALPLSLAPIPKSPSAVRP